MKIEGDKMRKKLSAKQRTSIFFKSVICVTVIAFCAILSITNLIQINEKEAEKRELTEKLEELKEEEKTLSDDVEKLKDPEYAGRYAREKYFYSKTGEKILKIN